jgi:hypothetical protein
LIVFPVSPNLFRYPHYLHHLLDRVHADDVRAAKNRSRDSRRRAPVALWRRPVADRLAKKRFPARADEYGPPE